MSMAVVFNIPHYDASIKHKYTIGEKAFISRALGRKLVTANVVTIIPAQQLREEQASRVAAKRETAVVKPVAEKPEPPEVEEINLQCKGVTASGEQCKAMPKNGDDYCWRHELQT
ncbi:MAG: hypothetical protein JRC90_11445 [Deltaproteobacteria bacterium]|nr:hypothetical protein [Deltaproteobacteria bacterium]